MKRIRHRKHLRKWVKCSIGFTITFTLVLLLVSRNSYPKENDIVILDNTFSVDQSAELTPSTTSMPYGLDEYQKINPYVFAIVEFDNTDGVHRIPVIETFSSLDGDYWMNHDVYGNQDTLGSAFVDEHTPLNDDFNHILINGHSSFDDSRMFTFMLHYADSDYFNDNPSFKLISDLGVENYTIISFAHYPMEQSIHTTGIFLNSRIQVADIKNYQIEDEPYIVHWRDANYSASRYISFVTCDQKDKSNRYILFARSDS